MVILILKCNLKCTEKKKRKDINKHSLKKIEVLCQLNTHGKMGVILFLNKTHNSTGIIFGH